MTWRAAIYITPVADEKLTIKREEGLFERREFRLTVPDEVPPSFATRDIRCQYAVKAIARGGFWKRSRIRQLQVTILPALQEELRPLPLELEVEHPELSLLVSLDQAVVLSGDTLSGSLVLDKRVEGARLPQSMSFRLAAIIESLDPFFSHREVLSLQTKDVKVDPEFVMPFMGVFDFPIPTTAEPSGTWNTFQVHYGFRVVLCDHDGKDYRRSAFIRVLRDLHERRGDDVPWALSN